MVAEGRQGVVRGGVEACAYHLVTLLGKKRPSALKRTRWPNAGHVAQDR